MHDFCESVLIISRALGHKQGTKIERVVLNRVCRYADALETSVMFLNHKSRLLMCGWNKSAASLWLLE